MTISEYRAISENFQTELEDLFHEHLGRTYCFYHYTNCESLISIISSRELWLTNIEFMNDPNEINYTLEIMKKALLLVEPDKNLQEEFLHKYKAWTEEATPSIYVLSLSTESDELSLWNNYSKNDGYNLGFNAYEFLKVLEETDPQKTGFQIASFSPGEAPEPIRTYLPGLVMYDEVRQIETLSFAAKKLIGLIKDEIQLNPDDSDLEEKAAIVDENWAQFTMATYLIKGPGHKNENEFRIAVFVPPESNKKVVRFRNRSGLITPYIVMKEFGPKLPFHSIALGPRVDDAIAKKGIEHLLRSSDRECKEINSSAIKHRF